MRWAIQVVLVALIFLSSAQTRTQADEASDQYNLAVGLYKQKRWNLSSEAFEEFVTKFPKHDRIAAAELYLGLSLVKQKTYAKARTQLRPYATKYPESKYLPDAMYQLAECSYFLKDLETAQTDFTAMLTKFPKHPLAEWALTYLGDAQLRTQKPEAALKSFQQSLKQFPQGRMSEEGYLGIARAYDALGQHEEALRRYEQIAGKNRKGRHAAQALLKMAARQYEMQQYTAALASYAQFQKTFPQHTQRGTAFLNSGYAHFQLKDYVAAIDQFEEAKQTATLNRTARYWIALCHKAQRDFPSSAAALRKLYEVDSNSTKQEKYQPEIVYHLADAELRQGHNEVALKLFLELCSKWPTTKIAQNSLHFATVAAFQSDDFLQTEQLLNRFNETYPQSGLKLRQQLIRARLLVANGGTENFEEANRLLNEVLASSTIHRTKTLARLHLGHTLTQQNKHQAALEMLEPLFTSDKTVLQVEEQKDALLLKALNHKELANYAEAGPLFQQYLTQFPNDERTVQVFSELLQVHASNDNPEDLQTILAALKTKAENEGLPTDAVQLRGLRMAAEATYNQEKWPQAETLFQALVDLAPHTPDEVSPGADYSGLAWSFFKQDEWNKAANAFNQLLTNYPEAEEFAPEALFMIGKSHESNAETNKAMEAYTKLREKWLTSETATFPVDAETEGAARFLFLSGLQAARLSKTEKNYAEANRQYGQLLDTFPLAKQHAELLDEWALMNLDAEQFAQADDIYRRLIKEHPESDLADNAKLSLAESDLIAGKQTEAQATFTELLQAESADASVKEAAAYQLVGIEAANSNWQSVIDQAKTFFEQHPTSEYKVKVETSFVTALLELNQTTQAEEHLTSLAESVPAADRSTELWMLLAEVPFRLKQYPKSLEVLNEFRQHKNDDLYLADEVEGRIYKNQAQFDKARTAFQKVLQNPNGKKTPTGAKSQFLLAETYLVQKSYQEAQKEYLKVYLTYTYPEWRAPALFQVARCDEALNQLDKAKESYRELIQNFPDSEYKSQAEERLRVVDSPSSE